MTGTLAPTIPTIGGPNSTEDADVKNSLETLRDGLNAILNNDNTVMGMQTYRTILFTQTSFASELSAGTYLFRPSGTALLSGSNIIWEDFPFFYFDNSDYEISGKTLKMRLRAQVASNATKPTIKFTFGLYPVTVTGGSNQFIPTVGTVVSGSTIEFNEPAASTITQKESSDFTIPSDGAYVLGVVTSAKLPASNLSHLAAQLQVRNV